MSDFSLSLILMPKESNSGFLCKKDALDYMETDTVQKVCGTVRVLQDPRVSVEMQVFHLPQGAFACASELQQRPDVQMLWAVLQANLWADWHVSGVAGITNVRHYTLLSFGFLVEMRFHHVGQAGLDLSLSDSPASASQVAGTTDVYHRAQLSFIFSVEMRFHHVDQVGLELLTSDRAWLCRPGWCAMAQSQSLQPQPSGLKESSTSASQVIETHRHSFGRLRWEDCSRPGVQDQSGKHSKIPSLQKIKKTSHVWWHTPVVPATPAEVGGSLELKSLRHQ
ncbi:hypothetical protein AAY473_007418 [Plecturocebus cupreus]